MNILDTVLSGTPSPAVNVLAQDESDDTNPEHSARSERSARVAKCSTFFNRIQDGTTGDWRLVPWRCGNVHECPICRKIKVDKVKGSLVSIANGVTKIRKNISNAEAAKLTRKLKSANYKRFPIDDDSCTILFVSDDDEGTPFTLAMMDTIDWDSLAISPIGKRTTGKLGAAIGKKPGVEKTKVALVNAPSATEEQWREAGDSAKKATENLDPKTAEEVDQALIKRAGFMLAELQRLGIPYTVQYVTQEYLLEDVNWQKSKGKPSMESEAVAREREVNRDHTRSQA